MELSRTMKAFAVGFALAVAPIAASAVTLKSSVHFDDPAFAYPDTSASVTLPSAAFWIAAPSIRTGNLTNIYRTPYDETPNSAVQNSTLGNAVAASIEFFAASKDNLENPAKLGFGGEQKSMSFLWGSPDTFNRLTFWLKGLEVGSFAGAPITASPSAGSQLVTYGGRFDEVWFGSVNANAFEFASITTTPVPLPAGAVLILTALGGFAVMRRRKS